MPRIEPIEMDAASGKAAELLGELASRRGEPGPWFEAMANAPAVLRSYLDLNRAVNRSHIDRSRHRAHQPRRARVAEAARTAWPRTPAPRANSISATSTSSWPA